MFHLYKSLETKPLQGLNWYVEYNTIYGKYKNP